MASVIVAGARTPFGKFGSAFKDVMMGQVLQAGAGQGGQGDALIISRPHS
jgi:acetyl-CoA acetyltransferase